MVIIKSNCPISWKRIKYICDKCNQENIDIFDDGDDIRRRTPEIAQKYEEWKNIQHNEDVLSNFLFDNTDDNIILIENDFPYDFESTDSYEIKHYVAWLRPHQDLYEFTSRMSDDLLNIIKEKLNKDLNNTIDIIYFRNNFDGRSVRSIPHYHVIVKILIN